MRRIWPAAFALALGACAHAPIPQSDTHFRVEKEEASGSVPAPVQISTVLPQPKPTARPETYSVVVNAVKVQELLFALARDAKLNIDVHSGISGTVTLNAIDQTLPQLLSRISRQVEMRWELDGPNLVVMPDTPYLRSYRVDYLNMERNATGTVGVSSQIGSTTGGAGGAGAAASTAGSGNASSATVNTRSDNKFWATLERNIRDILRETGGAPAGAAPPGAPSAVAGPSSVIVNAESGVIIVRATSRQHEKVQEFLDQVLTSAKRQVLIEATIAEVQLNNQYQQGIDWTALRARGATTVTGTQVTGGGDQPSSSGLVGNIISLAVQSTNISGMLQLLESFGTVRVLSSPKLSVLNNQTALLRVVDNLVYFNVQVTAVAGVNLQQSSTATNTTPVTASVGFVMNVTPQIAEDDTILLNVRPTTTRFVKFVNDPNPIFVPKPGEKPPPQNQVPQLRMREMESLIKVNSGQIAVLGGLIEDSLNDIEDTIPIVNSIPILGWFFQSRTRNNSKTELVVFIRPIVVKDASIDGDFRAYRNMIPKEDFMSRPNPGRGTSLFGGGSK